MYPDNDIYALIKKIKNYFNWQNISYNSKIALAMMIIWGCDEKECIDYNVNLFNK